MTFMQSLGMAARLGCVVVIKCRDGKRRPYRVFVDSDAFRLVLVEGIDLAKMSIMTVPVTP